MLINSRQNLSTQSFKANRYSTETVINFIIPNNMRKADSINFIRSISFITKEQHKALMQPDNIAFNKETKKVINHLLSQIPQLERFIEKADYLHPIYKQKVIENAKKLYGEEITIKKLINYKK